MFGALWAALPAYLQAKRGSHIVITTIMFNYIAASLLQFLLVDVLRPEGKMDPATATFPEATRLPSLADIPGFNLFFTKDVPANVTFLIALAMAVVVWALLWRTRLGYQIRAFGKSEPAARYAGINPTYIIMVVMLISGALAGLMAINNVMGEAERLLGNSASGAGFIGIAVALMGRNHPVGVVLAALLFGFLFQGGAELGLWTKIPIEMRTVVQGLVILFTGALDMMVRMLLGRVFALFRARSAAQGGPRDGLRNPSADPGFDAAAGDTLAAGLHRRALFRTRGRLRHRAGRQDADGGHGLGRGGVPDRSVWLGALAGIGGSLIFAAIHGVTAITFRGNQLIAGVALNFLASGLPCWWRRRCSARAGAPRRWKGRRGSTRSPCPSPKPPRTCRSSGRSIMR